MEYNQDAIKLITLLSPFHWLSFSELNEHIKDPEALSALLLKGAKLGLFVADYDAWKIGTFSPSQEAISTFEQCHPSIKDFTTKDIYKYELAKHLSDDLMVEIAMQGKEPDAVEEYRFVKTTAFTAKPKHYFFEELNARAGTGKYPKSKNRPVPKSSYSNTKQKTKTASKKRVYPLPASYTSRTRRVYKLAESRREKYNSEIDKVEALKRELEEAHKRWHDPEFDNYDRMAMK